MGCPVREIARARPFATAAAPGALLIGTFHERERDGEVGKCLRSLAEQIAQAARERLADRDGDRRLLLHDLQDGVAGEP